MHSVRVEVKAVWRFEMEQNLADARKQPTENKDMSTQREC